MGNDNTEIILFRVLICPYPVCVARVTGDGNNNWKYSNKVCRKIKISKTFCGLGIFWKSCILKKNLSYSLPSRLKSHLGKVNIETWMEFIFVDKFVEFYGQDVKYSIVNGEISELGKWKAE